MNTQEQRDFIQAQVLHVLQQVNPQLQAQPVNSRPVQQLPLYTDTVRQNYTSAGISYPQPSQLHQTMPLYEAGLQVRQPAQQTFMPLYEAGRQVLYTSPNYTMPLHEASREVIHPTQQTSMPLYGASSPAIQTTQSMPLYEVRQLDIHPGQLNNVPYENVLPLNFGQRYSTFNLDQGVSMQPVRQSLSQSYTTSSENILSEDDLDLLEIEALKKRIALKAKLLKESAEKTSCQLDKTVDSFSTATLASKQSALQSSIMTYGLNAAKPADNQVDDPFVSKQTTTVAVTPATLSAADHPALLAKQKWGFLNL